MLLEKHPEAESSLWFLNTRVRVALPGTSDADGICVLEHTLPFGEAPPLHLHHAEDELFFILEGEVLFRIGNTSRIAKAGDALVAPRGQAHGFRVISPEGARFLTITRGGFEDVIRTAGRLPESNGLPAPIEPTAEMQAALARICAAEGIDLLGPPIETA